jgi:hypothetical protein
MKAITQNRRSKCWISTVLGPFRSPLWRASLVVGLGALGGSLVPAGSAQARDTPPLATAPNILADADRPRPPFEFGAEDQALLEEIQRGCFQFFWSATAPQSQMVVDRTSASIVSVAGLGFQLSAIPIGVEHGWITREEGEARALQILRPLEANEGNRKFGLFFHYLDGATAGPAKEGYETVVSTIDSAILFAGMLTAGSYFEGETREIADRLFAAADWAAFIPPDKSVPKAHERGFISLGWKPTDRADPTGAGELLPFYWMDSGDEQRLVTFLAVCAPDGGRRVSPQVYYRMRRALGQYGGAPPFAWFPWSGALFTNFFAHCWIDWARMAPDTPAAFGVLSRPRIDWWENSRRAALMHRAKAIENPKGLPGLGAEAWGLSACDARSGYLVPGLFPELLRIEGWRPEFDYSTVKPEDNFGDGTIPPYSAGSAIMFVPEYSLEALRAYRALTNTRGEPLVWMGVGEGEYGFRDSFNRGAEWVAPDYVAIDQGPLILAIENARTGRVWDWFHAHPWVRSGTIRLAWTPLRR